MKNQNKIMEVVEQESSKKGLGKLALVAAGVGTVIAAGVGTVIFWMKKKEKQQNEEVEISEDSNESEEN